jgi:hypothetical protein
MTVLAERAGLRRAAIAVAQERGQICRYASTVLIMPDAGVKVHSEVDERLKMMFGRSWGRCRRRECAKFFCARD